MDITTWLGLIAGTLTTVSFFPQLYQAWKSKSTKDISLAMYSVFCAGILLWLIYGLLINSLPVILANIMTLIFALTILILKLKYR
jgi:MtN3 and saliva related transmembrane protein